MGWKVQPHSDCVTAISFHLQPQFCSCVQRGAQEDPRPKAGPGDSLLRGTEPEASWHDRYFVTREKAYCAPSFSPSVGPDTKKQQGNSHTTDPIKEQIQFLISLGGAALKKHKNEHSHSLTNRLPQETFIQLAGDTEGGTSPQKQHWAKNYTPTVRGYSILLAHKPSTVSKIHTQKNPDENKQEIFLLITATYGFCPRTREN